MQARSPLSRIAIGAATVWAVLILVICVFIPIGAVLLRVGSYQGLFDESILRVLVGTLSQAALSAGLAAAIALPLGIWIGGAETREREVCEFILSLPFGVPTVVAAMAWVIWLGRNGWLARAGVHADWSYSFKAVVLAHVVFNVPWIALWVAQSRAFLPPSRLEAARTLGAGAWRRFRVVLWPQVKWSFLSAVSQSFVFCSMSFALVLVLGGGPPVSTLETEIYSRIRFGSLDLTGAAVCAFWELLVTLIPWLLVVYFQSRQAAPQEAGQEASVSPDAAQGRDGGSFAGKWLQYATCLIWILPYFAILADRANAILRLSANAWETIWPALTISCSIAAWTCVLALVTAVAAVAVGGERSFLPARLRPVVGVFFGLPAGLSVLVLGLGAWLAYGRFIDPFAGSRLAIVFLQATIFFPLAFKIFWPVARDRPRALVSAARTLGASEWRIFRVVDWPRWKLPVLSAAGMIAAASLGEVSAVSLFYSETLIPLPLLISRWLGQYRFEDAQAVSAFLLLLCMGVVALSFLLRKRRIA